MLALAAAGAIVASMAAATAQAATDKAAARTATKGKVVAKQAAAKKPAARTLATCAWDRPNANPYVGELPGALDRYVDIPQATRTRLKERVAMQQYDDMVEIRRDAIVGKGTYAPEIRDMHFGSAGTVCKTVTRKKWKASTVERGLVYCEGAECVLVPTVCRNVSRVTRKDSPSARKPGGERTTKAAETGKESSSSAKAESPASATTSPPVTAIGPAFSEVAQAPVFGFPIGGGGTTVVVAPPGGTTGGDGGGGAGGGTVPGPGGGAPGGGAVGGDVATPIPEPSSWALMLGGLLAMGFLARRRGGVG